MKESMNQLENLDPRQWVLITHKDCLDGSTATLIWTLIGGNTVDLVHPFEADESYRRWKTSDRRVMFVDMAPQEEPLREQDVVLDHHVSNVDRFRGVDNALVDAGGCGCMHMFRAMMFDHVLGEHERRVVSMVRNLVEVVDDYDRHLGQRPVAEDLALYHEVLGSDQFSCCFTAKLLRGIVERTYFWGGNLNDFAVLNEADRKVVRLFKDMAERYVDDVSRNSWRLDDDGVGVVCAFADQHINMLCQKLLSDNPDCEYAVVADTKRGCLSFRSRVQDCTKLIESLGIIGGGHAQAAGARIPDWMWQELRTTIGV
jgi:hypothetical protein